MVEENNDKKEKKEKKIVRDTSLPKISVVVLYYKNGELIYQCLKSILEQNYPHIELIVSNDGSADFDEDEVTEFIEKNKEDNLVNYIVHSNKKNMGIVKNANIGFNMATGKYVKMIAADDAFYVNSAFKKCVEYFEESNANVIVTQCAAYDFSFQHLICYYPNKYYFNIVKTSTPEKLFSELSMVSLIHSPGVFLRRSFMCEHGGFDEKYTLIEDWPIWLRMSREGKKIHYLDMITVKYRRGGISNENVVYDLDTEKKYWTEYRQVLLEECYPYRDQLEPKARKQLTRTLKRLDFDIERNYEYPKYSKLKKLKFCLKHIEYIEYAHLKDYYRKFKRICANKQHIMESFIMGSLLLLLHALVKTVPIGGPAFSEALNYGFGILGCIMLGVCAVLLLFRCIRLIVKKEY